MTKSKNKIKQQVKLRMKELANGKTSLYLDTYKNGKRSYEFLSLYLLPGNDARTKEHNHSILIQAEAIRAKRDQEVLAVDMSSSEEGARKYRHLKLQELFVEYKDQQKESGCSPATVSLIDLTAKHLKAYNAEAEMQDIDKNFVLGFVNSLKATETYDGGRLAPASVHCYFGVFNTVLSYAVRNEMLASNPILLLERKQRPKRDESDREYLTAEEVRLLMETPCRHEEIKRAFLFSCNCGLRVSDIRKLTYTDIHTDNGKTEAHIKMKKTKKPIVVPLSVEACKYIPSRTESKDGVHVFPLPTLPTIERHIAKWASAAGISKHVTFHVARHTFATSGLTADVDIYTVSKLLGHTKLTTTQRYAKLIDKKKDDAVNKIGALYAGQDTKD